MIVKALSSPRMVKAIVNSWAHCGIHPIEEAKAALLVRSETPKARRLRDPDLQYVLAANRDRVEQLHATKRAADTVRKQITRAPSGGLSQARVLHLNNPLNIAIIKQHSELTEVKKMKAAELHAHVRRHHADEIVMPGGKWLNMSALVELEAERLNAAIKPLEERLIVKVRDINSKRLLCVAEELEAVDVMEIESGGFRDDSVRNDPDLQPMSDAALFEAAERLLVDFN